MDLQLENKTALVTASSGGIGIAIAESLAKEGVEVIINGRSDESVSEAINELQEKTNSTKFKKAIGDLGKKEDCDKIIEQYPDVDILINNVGFYEAKPFFEETEEDWQTIFDVNIMSAVRLSQHYGKKMIDKGNGRVIFVSSETAVNPDPNMAHYGATKTMMLSISRNLAELTSGTDVTVNAVMPGSTDTESVRELIKEQFSDMDIEEGMKKFMEENRPTSILGRLLKVEEIADMVTFVCSPKASGINGAALRVDGGIVKSVF
ncbi:SDR family oxidoreductase [Litoribacter ruber]|uniref:SDR family oxidoreductase n=1 Tax=Litoribacter ruber TaxID=702568 RepID=A0AAP2G3E9_9BACT|nr:MULTISPECIES: SDR family oxidoreductase [Litoribacter]MBS9522936.1 SDR family oxidoreductase [Litoribacter alkaliphilus]MBT0810900.1 SDR family oxidoreductase [Litoribacter ruber]